MTTFPTTLDTWTNPTATTPENQAGLEHDVLHSNHNDQIQALETKVGINGSTDPNSLDFKVNNLMVVGTADPSTTPTLPVQLFINATAVPPRIWLWFNSAWTQVI